MAERLGLSNLDGPARAGLPEPEPPAAPRTAMEVFLAELWTDVLGRDGVGVHDRFLDSGGDSMLATRLLARVRTELRLEVSLIDFFDSPTIASQAALLEELLLADER
jgi:hypothetical protein